MYVRTVAKSFEVETNLVLLVGLFYLAQPSPLTVNQTIKMHSFPLRFWQLTTFYKTKSVK